MISFGLFRLARRSAVLRVFCVAVAFSRLAPLMQARTLNPSGSADIAHFSWTARDGAPSEIVALAQTSDGYLWLGTPFGLFRFDGLRFASYPFSPGLAPLPSGDVSALAADKSGGLWIGFRHGGIARLTADSLTNFPEAPGLEGATTDQILPSTDGSIWMITKGKVMLLHGADWVNYGIEHGLPSSQNIFALFLDRNGNLWASSRRHIYLQRNGAAQFEPYATPTFSVTQFAESSSGQIWISDGWRGIRPLQGNCSTSPMPLAGSANLLIDGDDRVWIGEDYLGVSIAQLPKEVLCGSVIERSRLSEAQGLTSAQTLSLLRDKDGNIWVGTPHGLDRLRTTPFHRHIQSGFEFYPALAAGNDGSVWIGVQSRPVQLWKGDGARVVGPRVGTSPFTVDVTGNLWLKDPYTHNLYRYSADGREISKFRTPGDLTDVAVQSITSDRSGALFLAFEDHGLWRFAQNRWEHLSGFPTDTPTVLFTASDDRIWCGFAHNRLAVLGKTGVSLYTEQQGISVDTILTLQEHDGDLWIGGSGGVARFHGGRFTQFRTQRSNFTSGVSGLVFDNAGDLWMNGGKGVIHVASAELARALRDDRYAVFASAFGVDDGIIGSPAQVKPTPSAISDGQGTLWFGTAGSLVSLKAASRGGPASLPHVAIQNIQLDDQPLQAGSMQEILLRGGKPNKLEIDFVGIDLSTPERVIYRYKLDGEDKDWQQAGDRPQATYAHLVPGHYRFHVSASNGQGGWSELRVPLAVTVKPAFFQTPWFYAVCLAAAGLILWLIYLLRLQQVTSRIRDRLEQRESERLRIAREIHDTLLQSIHGLMLRFHFAQEAMHPKDPARPGLQLAMQRADELILEGRNNVQGLRGEADQAQTFAEMLGHMARDLQAGHDAEIRVSEEGAPRPLRPNVQTELCNIARECLTNAFRHAKSTKIELELFHSRRSLRMRCRDNGVGIPEAILTEGGKKGHWGLKGMKERAATIGTRVEIWSSPGEGTEIEVDLPASIAYAPGFSRRSILRDRGRI